MPSFEKLDRTTDYNNKNPLNRNCENPNQSINQNNFALKDS